MAALSKSLLNEAKIEEVPIIVSLLTEMQDELQELPFDPAIATQSITNSLSENVVWFLFRDEANEIFGTCYLQSVHNYWRAGKRYYLGGFYIAPTHRRNGRFREINRLLKDWATAHDGVQLYAHIHKDNQKSLSAFGAMEFAANDYRLCVKRWANGKLCI